MHRHTGYEQLESMAKVDIKTLPLLQGKVLAAISLLDDPDSDFYQLINQLSPDITAKFIEFAGSSLYGHKVHSIDHAVRLLGKEYQAIIEKKEGEGLSSNEAEQQVLGLNHAEIGSLVLKKCHMPDDICDAVRFHERADVDTEDDEAFQLLLILRQTSQLANNLSLPTQEISPQSLPNQLQAAIRQGHLLHQDLRREMQKSHGLRHIVKTSIERSSVLLEQELGKLFPPRMV